MDITPRRIAAALLLSAAAAGLTTPAAALPAPGPLKKVVPDVDPDQLSSTLNSGQLLADTNSNTAQGGSHITTNDRSEALVSIIN
jgi:hypothetical protein